MKECQRKLFAVMHIQKSSFMSPSRSQICVLIFLGFCCFLSFIRVSFDVIMETIRMQEPSSLMAAVCVPEYQSEDYLLMCKKGQNIGKDKKRACPLVSWADSIISVHTRIGTVMFKI